MAYHGFKSLTALLYLMASLFSGTVLGNTEQRPDAPVKICVDPNWMPFEKIDEDGKHIGISADFMQYFSEATGIDFQLVPTQSWQQSLAYTRNGTCQLLPLINKTEERSEYLDFSDVYFESPVVLVSHQDRKIKGGFQGLKDKTLAIVKDYSYESFIAEHYPDVRIIPVESMDQALMLVSESEADATTATLYMFPYQLQQLRISDLQVASATELVNELRVGVNKESSYLLPLFNRAIAEIPQQLKNETILKWTPKQPLSNQPAATPLYFLVIILAAFFALWLTWQANKKLRTHNRKLKIIAATDTLTGIANRNGISLMLEREIENTGKTECPFSVILLDIDHFKSINDNFGHDVGDEALCFITRQISTCLRSSDAIGRWGGEEFLVLASATNLDQAVKLANKLRDAIKSQPLEEIGAITASFGVTEYQASDSIDMLIKRADVALYDAKASGRDRVRALAGSPH